MPGGLRRNARISHISGQTTNSGGLASGIGRGLLCLGCCLMLMALLFVGGIMNFAWIAGIALLVLIEKTLPRGRRVSQVTGAVLVVWGAVTLATAARP
jgi:predicted metal-binding membrane protein